MRDGGSATSLAARRPGSFTLYRVQGLGFRVKGLGFGVKGLGLRVKALGFWGFTLYRVQGLGVKG